MNDLEIGKFIERLKEIGDVWEEDDVRRVYGEYSFDEAMEDRMTDINMFADIVGKIINSRQHNKTIDWL